jgi:hypothetical protein
MLGVIAKTFLKARQNELWLSNPAASVMSQNAREL